MRARPMLSRRHVLVAVLLAAPSLGCQGVQEHGETSMAESESEDSSSEMEAPEEVLWADRVLNIAHAGGKGMRPENTIVACEQALLDGAEVLELDVHATADGVLVVIHDETVDRTTDGTGRVKDLTFAEIRALDAGHHFTPDGGATHPFRGMGVTIPSLEEVLDAFPDVPYVLEIKQVDPPIVEPFIELCRDKGILDHLVIASFHEGPLLEVRDRLPEVPTNFSVPEVIELLALSGDDEADYLPPAEFLQVPIELQGISVLTPELAEKAARLDLKVHAWTINDVAEMQMLVDMGVDGIITDYPERLRDLLEP
jgi:glycerophosphoryl diester phosphodiesterase